MGKNFFNNLVTGGSGFLGSHLIDKLMLRGESVICIDNFITGNKSNLNKWINNENFKLIEHDIKDPIELNAEKIWHLAGIASPIYYQKYPLDTIKTNFLGTLNILELAKNLNAKILFASSSEIYGDPLVHPQIENYFGNVNPIGNRSCYNEGKRIAETLFFAYKRLCSLDIKVIRIFNTYGPRMMYNDGRVICNFINQALNDKPLTIFGDGLQTRSFCYVDDLISGMLKVMAGEISGPINLGNSEEITILELARKIVKKTNSNKGITFGKLPENDPKRRKPSIKIAKNIYNWHPKVSLDEGLDITIDYFRNL